MPMHSIGVYLYSMNKTCSVCRCERSGAQIMKYWLCSAPWWESDLGMSLVRGDPLSQVGCQILFLFWSCWHIPARVVSIANGISSSWEPSLVLVTPVTPVTPVHQSQQGCCTKSPMCSAVYLLVQLIVAMKVSWDLSHHSKYGSCPVFD